jgi:uncharacterized membrane protein
LYEKYETPGEEYGPEGGGALEKAEEIAASVIERVAENKKQVAAVVVLLIAAYFTYDFFIGSFRTVEVVVTDTEGGAMNAAVRVIGADGSVAERFTGGKTVKIRKGEYTIEARSAGYLTSRRTYVISGDDEVTIELERDMDIGIEGSFPEQMLNGEKAEVVIELTNRGNEPEEASLVFEGFGANIKTSYLPETIVLAPAQALPVVVYVEVSGSAEAKTVNGIVRVRYTKESIPAKLEIKKFSDASVTLSRSRLEQTVSAAEAAKKDFTIKNSNSFPLSDVEVSVAITTANYVREKENGEWAAEDWFTTDPSGVFEIPSKEGGRPGERIVEITVNPQVGDLEIPAEADAATVSGDIIIKSSYMEKSLRFEYTIRKSEAKIRVEGLDNRYSAEYSSTSFSYSIDDYGLKLKNSGNVSLKEVRVRDFECKQDPAAAFGKTDEITVITGYWPEITPTDEKTTTLTINMNAAHAANTTFYCKMIVSYDNPFFVPGSDQPISILQEKEFQILTVAEQ